MAGNLIEIEGYSPDFLRGYNIEWYDLSLEAGRNAKGTMRLSYIASKYKIILKTIPLLQPQLTEFYSHIPMREIAVNFFNPFTGQWQTVKCYRGDRKISSEYVLGQADNTTKFVKIGTVLSILQSKWGFLFIIVLPALLAFIYQISIVVSEIKGSKEEK